MAGRTEDRYMDQPEAAAVLDCSTRTVQRLMTKYEKTGGAEGLAFERVTDARESKRRPLRQAVYDLAGRRVPHPSSY